MQPSDEPNFPPNTKAPDDALAAAQQALAAAEAQMRSAQQSSANGPDPAQGDVLNAQAGETDIEFALRVFGVNDKTFINADGTLNRAALDASISTYRHLYANRLLHGAPQ